MPRRLKSILIIPLFLFFCAAFVFAEEVTITTYYPSPYGSYNQLQTSTLGVGDNDGDSSLTGADVPPASSPGEVWIKGNVGIGTGTVTPEFRLTLDKGATTPDGGILAIGTNASGATLTTAGAGTRLIWYPNKGAFRAGGVNANQWDDANIGNYSVATGYGTTAGAYSTATGYSSTASGAYSTAMGNNTIASGSNSIAMGNNTTASGWCSRVLGFFSTASGTDSTAIGDNLTASGEGSIAMGSQITTSGFYSIALGYQATSSGMGSIATGCATRSSGIGSTALGYQANASGNCSVATGYATAASGYCATATGQSTAAIGESSTAMGYHTTASGQYSTAMGYQTTASNYASTAIGASSTASGSCSSAIGLWARATGNYSTALGARPQAQGESSLAMGGDSIARGMYSTAMGWSTLASGLYSTVMGQAITVSGNYSVGIGLSWTNSIIAADNVMAIMGGKVGIGTVAPSAVLHVNGNIKAVLNDIDGNSVANMRYSVGTSEIGYDVAELFEASQEVQPGDVLSIDDHGKLKKSDLAYDSKVAGVVSEAPAILFEGSQLEIAPQPFKFKQGNKPPVALAGKIKCKVTNEGGKIKAGDLLVTSSKPGYAMKGEPDKLRFGTILGKALEPLNEKEGAILILVTLE